MAIYQIFRMGLRAVPEIMFYVFIYSNSEAKLKTQQASRTLQFVCSKQNRTSVLLIHTEHAGSYVCLFEIIRPYVCITHELNFTCPIIKLR